jgi:hypothetical protein
LNTILLYGYKRNFPALFHPIPRYRVSGPPLAIGDFYRDCVLNYK